MIVIAHGQPKSGSTFLYSAAIKIVEHVNGEEFYSFMRRVLGPEFQPYYDRISVDLILDASEALRPGQMFVIKTHSKLFDDVAELITQGRVKAFTSFRDPRDTALSTLNVAERDRAKGVERWFATITELKQLRDPIKNQSINAARWAGNPAVLTIPYYLTAISEATSVALIARHLGAAHLEAVLAAEMMAKRESLPEFNKGLLDRFVDELSVEDLTSCSEIWADIIAEYNVLLAATMARLGHRLAYWYFTGLRDARIRERLAELELARPSRTIRSV